MASFQPFKIFTPSPILGYGYDFDEFWRTVKDERPAVIILDAGSTDPGPYMLGTNKTLCSRESYIRDLTPILEACSAYGMRLLVSSAGGAGTNEQVDFLVVIIQDLINAKDWNFNVATIKFNDDRAAFVSKLRAGEINSCASSPPLTEPDLRDATRVVAQMGAEPFLKVLEDDSIDIIISGRSYDPAPFAAFCMHHGVQPSPAWHVGKIIECGGLCTVPKGRSILATMYEDCFVLTPTKTGDRCTSVSVAAHTLYEKTRPDRLPGPGGVLHLEGAQYIEQADGRSVLVHGSEFVPSPRYEIKLEGVQQVGFRSTFIGGIRDPILIAGIDAFLVTVRETTFAAFPTLGKDGGPQLIFHLYGKNAVMGPLETSTQVPHEIGVLGEVTAETQELATAIAGFARTAVLHGAYEGQMATSGNLALPLTPLESELGPVFRFSVYHLLVVEDPLEFFPVEIMKAGKIKDRPARECAVGNGSTPKAMVVLDELTRTTVEHGGRNGIDTTSSAEAIRIMDLAKVIRSKNSGPFEVTLDICFANRHDFQRVRQAKVLSAELVKDLYALTSTDDIVIAMFYEPALAWKCTFKRPWPQGSIGERDTFGAQMHAPLLSVVVPGTKAGH
ncbi:hypothetical protein CAC42_4766 [Sphaceloma murrayae]|uniref:Uncharacterized protein n=1 Tax=Sphaceloma murrayae TaxID=2082308 RepID=A0A2K1QP51_9PEZI|nr:hypothetical protein CAC42_4766 [Sphaceloma murrayae]